MTRTKKTSEKALIPPFKSSVLNPAKNNYLKIFLICFGIMAIIFLPTIIFNKGYFLYYGDFNSQQLMFYKHCNEVIKSGSFWDWGTDLGSDFLGSYSFYTVGSPFYWLSVLFPSSVAPMLIPWLIAIKTGVAGVTSYAYIKRFVKSENAALIGAMLYAMSGFQSYNIFFNHFHDVTALFPLLLIALEERVQNDRRGFFALAVGLMATVNYFFFAGQVTFLIIYFLIRCLNSSFRISFSKLVGLVIESVLGVGIAAFLLLPSVILVLQNPRLDGRLYGLDMVVYSDKTRVMRIIQSFFMLPDPPARSNLFAQSTARWSSIAGYLPLFSMIGVISFLRQKKSHWASRIIWVCAFFAVIPILNTSFYMFNSSYYARWFYMPLLLLAMMTAYAIDNKEVGLKKGYPIAFFGALFFAIVSFLPKKSNDEVTYFSLAQYKDLWILQLCITFGCLCAAYYIISSKNQSKKFLKRLCVATAVFCYICTASIVYYGVAQGPVPENYIEHAVNGGDDITIAEEDASFYRIDVSDSRDNWPMFWGDYHNIRCFQSVVTGSIMEFYPEIGIDRSVATRAETDIYQLRGLTSVKYYFDYVGNGDSSESIVINGFSFYKSQGAFDIYINDHFVPMGYVYENYFDPEDYEGYSDEVKQKLLMAGVYLNDEQIEKYGDIMTELENINKHLSIDEYYKDCERAAAQSCYEFEENGNGFEAKIALEKESLVFFSVPYSEGFTAYVNGVETEIDKVYNGLSAIRAPAGDNEIVFEYETPGFKTGIIISVISLLALLGYVFIFKRFVKKAPKAAPEYDYEPKWKND